MPSMRHLFRISVGLCHLSMYFLSSTLYDVGYGGWWNEIPCQIVYSHTKDHLADATCGEYFKPAFFVFYLYFHSFLIQFKYQT